MAMIIGKEVKGVNKGRWVKFEGSQFLVAHTSNLKFQRIIQQLQHPYRKKIEESKLDPAILKDIMCDGMSKAILLDWKEVQDTEGNEVPFSIEAAKAVLLVDDDFREFIQATAADFSAYKQEQTADAGNA
jgi:hypothetical protein